MKFSVIVPFLNEERHIRQCIAALNAQAFERTAFELIFVDNGSKDRSREYVRGEPSIRYLFEPEADAYLARNLGARHARGDILVFIDADCIAGVDLLSEYARVFEQEDVALAFGRLSLPSAHSKILKYYEDYNRSKMKLMATSLPRESCYGHAGNMAIRRTLFEQLGTFCRMPLVGDADIVQKYFSAFPGSRFSYVDSAEVVHLEVDSVSALFGKLYAYGVYSGTYSKHASFRTASLSEKVSTFISCAREEQYSFLSQLALLCVLAIQYLSFFCGSMKARLST